MLIMLIIMAVEAAVKEIKQGKIDSWDRPVDRASMAVALFLKMAARFLLPTMHLLSSDYNFRNLLFSLYKTI